MIEFSQLKPQIKKLILDNQFFYEDHLMRK